jgi:glycerol kinase
MPPFILAVDQGTTSSRAMLFDGGLRLRGIGRKEFPQVFPRPGWVEHDPRAIWDSVEAAVSQAVRGSGIRPSDIAAVGIANQRETVVLWDPASGDPLCNAVVWQCRRSAGICDRLKRRGLEAEYSRRTGLLLDPYFSGTKLAWLFENDRALRSKAASGALKAGTVDSYLVYRMTAGGSHVTDASNASRTLLLDIHSAAWDPGLCGELGVPPAILPRVAGSSEIYGRTRGMSSLPDGIPIAGMAGDQQAALFGQACFSKGEAKCTFGTGSFLLMNTGSKPVASKNRLLTTIAWRLGGRTAYALEGSVFIAGALVQWLRDGLGIIASSPEVESLAARAGSSGGVVIVPAFAGLGAPHWRAEARGLISGITRGTTSAHIARAALEAIALQNAELIRAMESDCGFRLKGLRVDGGASANDLLMQMQADLIGRSLRRPRIIETTALGAAFLAGLAVGRWSGLGEIAEACEAGREFAPGPGARGRKELLRRWEEALVKA